MTQTPEQIAAKLSPAKRRWILAAKECVGPHYALPAYTNSGRVSRPTIVGCEDIGLTFGTYPPKTYLTELGLAVRSILQAQENTNAQV